MTITILLHSTETGEVQPWIYLNRKTMNSKSLMLIAFSVSASITQVAAQAKPQKSSPQQLVDDFHAAFGNHHARAIHTKGIILDGEFTPSAQAATLTTAVHLQKEKSKVTLRFSDFAGIPDIPDNSPLANPRGMAIKFITSDGAATDIIAHSFDGFPTATTDEFHLLLKALAASGPNVKKPTQLDQFITTHPKVKTFLTTQRNPKSFATISYFGVNSFQFLNRAGKSTYIRYQFIPQGGEKLISNKQMAASGKQYMMTEIRKRLENGPVVFNMYAQIAAKGDDIDDPSTAWPASRKKVLLGTITLKKVTQNTVQEDKALLFSPLNLPAGIKPADPMLNVRGVAYPLSFTERQ